MPVLSVASAVAPLTVAAAEANVRPATAHGRWVELDSLRGVASLVVFFYHCIFLLAVYPGWIKALLKSPLSLFVYGGHQAVILFFVLSGFVLYLPYGSKRGGPPYRVFVVRRICRIYLPYVVSVLAVLAAYLCFFHPQAPAGLSRLYGWKILSRRDLVWSVASHLVFIGFFNRDVFNGVTWTLAEEMRISLIYPLIAAMVQRVRPLTILLGAVCGSFLVGCAVVLAHRRSPWETFHYACLFTLGAVVAANFEALQRFWSRQTPWERIAVLVASVVLCAYVSAIADAHPGLVREELADWLIALPTAVFLIASVSEPWLRKTLRVKVLEHCGRMSYGIYLFHLPILFALVNLLWGKVPHIVVYGVGLALTLLIADLFHRFVELPCIALGKRLTSVPSQSLR